MRRCSVSGKLSTVRPGQRPEPERVRSLEPAVDRVAAPREPSKANSERSRQVMDGVIDGSPVFPTTGEGGRRNDFRWSPFCGKISDNRSRPGRLLDDAEGAS